MPYWNDLRDEDRQAIREAFETWSGGGQDYWVGEAMNCYMAFRHVLLQRERRYLLATMASTESRERD